MVHNATAGDFIELLKSCKSSDGKHNGLGLIKDAYTYSKEAFRLWNVDRKVSGTHIIDAGISWFTTKYPARMSSLNVFIITNLPSTTIIPTIEEIVNYKEEEYDYT